MSIQLGYNSTETPVVVDSEGRSIGGRSWGPYDDTDPIAQREVALQRLCLVANPAAVRDSNVPEAQVAYAAYQDRLELAAAEEAAAITPAPQTAASKRKSAKGKTADVPADDAVVEPKSDNPPPSGTK